MSLYRNSAILFSHDLLVGCLFIANFKVSPTQPNYILLLGLHKKIPMVPMSQDDIELSELDLILSEDDKLMYYLGSCLKQQVCLFSTVYNHYLSSGRPFGSKLL